MDFIFLKFFKGPFIDFSLTHTTDTRIKKIVNSTLKMRIKNSTLKILNTEGGTDRLQSKVGVQKYGLLRELFKPSFNTLPSIPVVFPI